MKPRNFVAKHAQRSGAGKHRDKHMNKLEQEITDGITKAINDALKQRKNMKVYEDGWVREEDVCHLEDKLEAANMLLSVLQEEQVQTLAQIIRIRDIALSSNSPLVYALNDLITWFSNDTLRDAVNLLMRKDDEENN